MKVEIIFLLDLSTNILCDLDIMDSLPTLVVEKILNYGDVYTKLLSRMVCKTWNSVLGPVRRTNKGSIILYAIKRKYYSIVRWSTNPHSLGNTINKKIAIEKSMVWAVQHNRITILKWMNRRFKLNGDIWTCAAKYARIGVLEWLASCNIPGNKLLYEGAIEANNPGVVRWGITHGVPVTMGNLKRAVKIGSLDALLCIAEHLGKINMTLYHEAAKYNHLHVLEWLFNNGIQLNNRIILKIIQDGKVESVDWLFRHGVKFPRNTCQLAYDYGNYKVLEWALSTKFRCDDSIYGKIEIQASSDKSKILGMLDILGKGGVNINNIEYLRYLYKAALDIPHIDVLNKLYQYHGIIHDPLFYNNCNVYARYWLNGHVRIISPAPENTLTLPLPAELIEAVLKSQDSVMKMVSIFVCKEWYNLLKGKNNKRIEKLDIIGYAIENNYPNLALWGIKSRVPHNIIYDEKGNMTSDVSNINGANTEN